MKSYSIYVEHANSLAAVERRVSRALGNDILMTSNNTELCNKCEIILLPAGKKRSEKKFEQVANHVMARALSEVIVKDMLLCTVRKILKDISFLTETEKNRAAFIAIEQMCAKKDFMEWQACCTERLYNYFSESSEISLDGFMLFRMKEMYNEWKRAARLAAEEIVIEREFAEFINLLRSIVDLQKPGLSEVHVVPLNDGYVLLDSQMHELRPIDGFLEDRLDKGMSREDLLISSLINIAPMKITIHGEKSMENSLIMHTIDKIFPGRVIFERSESPN